MTLERRAAMAALVKDRDDDLLVVPGLGSTTWDLAAAGDDPRNFYLWGAMGGAAMIGLGLALAQPDRRVAVDRVGALGGTASGAGRPDHGIVPVDQAGQGVDVHRLDVGDDRGGSVGEQVLDVGGVADDAGHLVGAGDEQGGEESGH